EQVGDGVRTRSRQERREGVGVPHEWRKRARRTGGRRRGRQVRVLRRQRHAVADTWRNARREDRHGRGRLAEAAGTAGGRGSAAQGAAVTAVPGIVFSGSGDGGLRAYATDDGTLIWSFDTNKEFTTVNGVKANGAAMDGPGAAVSDGMLYINSGYGGLVGRP